MSERPEYEANLERSELLFGIGRFQDCADYAQRAIEINPRGAEAYLLLSHAFTRIAGRNRDALEAIDMALSVEADRSLFHAWRAYVLDCLGKQKQAIKVATDALVLNPQEVLAYIVRAQAYTHARRWVEAEKDIREALAIEPDNLIAQGLLAQALRLRKQWKESEAIIKFVLSQTPHNCFALTNAGWLAIEAGNLWVAAEYVQNALACDPNNEFARRTWFEILRRRIFFYRWETWWKMWVLDFMISLGDSKVKYLAFIPYVGIFLICISGVLLISAAFFWALIRSFADYLICVDSTTRYSLTTREWYLTLFKGLIIVPVLIYLLLT